VFQVHGIDAAEKVVVAFAVRAPEGTLRVCLINQNITRDERAAIDLGGKFTAASMLRLAGPPILTGHEFIVDVPAASATLVSLRG